MKNNKILSLLLIFLTALTVPLALTGCKTTETGTKVVDPEVARRIAPAMRTAVAGAVVYAYTKDANSVKYIDVIKTALQEFILSNDLSPSSLQAKIYALPVRELKSAEAQLIITPLLAAYKAFGEDYVREGLGEQEGWKLLVKALTDGIDDGLQGVDQIKQGRSGS
jgi:hypothetical protein